MLRALLSKSFTKRKMEYFDYSLVISVLILCIFGIICIGSATRINLGESKSTFNSQILFFITGLFIMVFMAFIVDNKLLSKLCVPMYIGIIGLLVAVLIVGRNAQGATRWIRIGPIGIQPSEFAKLVMIICLSKYIDKKSEKINNIGVLLLICLITAIPVYLISKQPSLSVCLVILAIMVIITFSAGVSYKIILSCIAIGGVIGAIIVWDVLNDPHLFVDKILYPHQINRIKTFFNPDANSATYYQTLQSIYAIGSGQFSGKGLYQGSLNQLNYLPEPQNDFIFSVIGEEFGFIGCMSVLVLLLFVIFRCMVIAYFADDTFSRLMAIGVGGMIAVQTLVNMGVATGILPNTGMSLPFISSGGSSLWTNMAAIGLVLNINMRRSRSLFEGV